MGIFTKFFKRTESSPVNIVNGEVGLTMGNVRQHIARFENGIAQELVKPADEINNVHLADMQKWLAYYKAILNGPEGL